jgi:hypothetical protein
MRQGPLASLRDAGRKRYYGGAKCVAHGHDSRFHSVGPWLRVQDAGLRCFSTNICLWFCGMGSRIRAIGLHVSEFKNTKNLGSRV